MKRFALLIPVLICLGAPVYAADVPTADVFSGFSLNRVSSEDGHITFAGWQANVSWNVYKTIGVVGDFAREFKSDEDGQTLFLFGSRVHARMEKWTVFGEALFGGDRIAGEKFFAMAYGGGIDVTAGKVNIRVVQFDWIPIRLGNGDPWLKNNTRLGVGLVFPIGGE